MAQPLHTITELTTPAAGFKLLGDDGATTKLVDVNNLPVQAAVGEQLSGKADTTTMDTSLNAMSAQIATKENALTFVGATRVGNTVSVDPAIVGGVLTDGVSFYVAPNATSWTTFGAQVSALQVVGTYTGTGPNNPTNTWNNRGRGGYVSAATAGSKAQTLIHPRVRYPNTAATPTIGGFKVAIPYASSDALTACQGFVGTVQNIPAANTSPAAYTGSSFGFGYTPTDTNFKLYLNGVVVKDLGASFPCNGNETNPYLFEIESVPAVGAAARYVRWKATHLISGATDSGTHDGPAGDHTPMVGIIRDNAANAAACQWMSTGIYGGSFYSLAIGERLDVPPPVRITADTTLTRVAHANVDLFVESATPVTLTVKNSGYTDGDKLVGQNDGAGAITFVGEGGFTINKHVDLPATVAQWQGFTLTYNATANRWVRTA